MKKMRYKVTTWQILAEVDGLMTDSPGWNPEKWLKKNPPKTYRVRKRVRRDIYMDGGL